MKWKIPVKSLFRMKICKIMPMLFYSGVRLGKGNPTDSFPYCKKKWNRKIMRNFSVFFSFFGNLGSSNLINSRNNETSDILDLYFLVSFFIFCLFSWCCAVENCNVCGRENVKTIWKLYVTFMQILRGSHEFLVEFNYQQF